MPPTPSPLDRQPHDLGVKQMAPLSPTDLRVPTPEEFDLDSRIGINLFRAGRSEHRWLKMPTFTYSNNTFAISGKLLQIGAPEPVTLSRVQFTPPPLPNTFSQIDRYDRLYLVGFTAEVGELEDPLLGQFSYGFAGGVNSLAKENTRRYRYFWVLFYAIDSMLTVANVVAALGNAKSLPIPNLLDTGFSRSGYQIYAKDRHLTADKTYKVLTDTIDVSPILGLYRHQNTTYNGYSYGINAEVFNIDDVVSLAERPSDEYEDRIEDICRQRFLNIAAGKVGKTDQYKRSVLNVSIGSNPANPGHQGISALSLNGSHATANDQRISFTNQAITETRQSYPLTVTLSTTGNSLISTGLNTNAPPGSVFSSDKTLHKIYKSDGTEQSQYGTWSNLSGTGGLQWLGTSNSTLIEGEVAYVVPAVDYPGGSGFDIPFLTVEKAWRNSVEISSANIRMGWSADLSAYENPVNGEEYILVLGTERVALHYIYRKVSIQVTANGVAAVPPSMNGCIAFIEGVPGRIDLPVKAGIPSGAVNALIYHAPKSNDTWQIQVRAPDYQGIGEPIAGEICGTPIVYGHSQGAGGSVFRGELSTRYRPIALSLPTTGTGIPSYSLDTPIQLSGEEYRGPVSLRELDLLPGSTGIEPSVGNQVEFGTATGTYERSLSAPAIVNGEIIGFYAPLLANKKPYQIAIVIPIRTAEGRYFGIIATKNTIGGENILLDPATGVAIDTFYL
jgi:hypothetical protein